MGSVVGWLLQIRESLTKRAKEFNILVDDVAITHLSFGTEVTLPDAAFAHSLPASGKERAICQHDLPLTLCHALFSDVTVKYCAL